MSFQPITTEDKARAFDELREIKSLFASRGWFAGTSGNLSVRVGDYAPEQFHFAVTASGKDKSKETPEDFLFVDQTGKPVEATGLKPSAETLIHCEIYRQTGCGAIFHVHTVFNNLVSERFWERRSVPVDGVELIKAFNIWEEEAHIDIPIVSNYAEIPRIVPEVIERLDSRIPGILLRKHGIYAWGANAFEAKRHIEAFEFLFEYVYRWELLNAGVAGK
ncbi:methylthioribulose-1-phosphate dehydratase [Paenibacillus darwinianus]|uniref:Methylthioribulose-1-phosphate dehydratase n=1 Tax=Paenibacillus darwinianus TaxID=1380763 RepID=A0A9W5S2L2_9BACL|nr:methylthioribulose 1-phosphate dehydratase [Paenibacillus darwinianus]EXX91170.1 methylthioribulose-1-phosphate dehydratase [Paenibacillus darwinianus]EXX92037.1 methylthioribulose-1-phosphate dehydratase [Paenibacillus darwinianus]EXX92628.1 methylthioribulose-1-phosphate dehydratase [Paenibacillus darwinianus]